MSKSNQNTVNASMEEVEERLDPPRNGIEVGEHAGILYVTRQQGDDETVIEAEHINVVRVTITVCRPGRCRRSPLRSEMSRKQAERTGLMLFRAADRMSR